jgi:hypothetical protein
MIKVLILHVSFFQMDKKKVIINGAAVALTSSIIVFSAINVSAQSRENSAIFEKVGEILNLDSERISVAFKIARVKRIQEKIGNGEISREDGQLLISQINANNPFIGLGMQGNFMKTRRADLIDFLGLTPSEFHQERISGKTVLQIATERGISKTELINFLKEEQTEFIESSEKIPENRKEKMEENLDLLIEKIINR